MQMVLRGDRSYKRWRRATHRLVECIYLRVAKSEQELKFVNPKLSGAGYLWDTDDIAVVANVMRCIYFVTVEYPHKAVSF